jgi:site-specific recombinase XerD
MPMTNDEQYFQLLLTFKSYLLEQSLNPSTQKQYLLHTKAFCLFALDELLAIDELYPLQILKYKTLLQEKKYAERTINAHLFSLKRFFRFLVEREIVTQNPVLEDFFERDLLAVKEYLAPSQIREVIRCIQHKKENIRAAFWLMLATGLSAKETASVTKNDFAEFHGKLFVTLPDRQVFVHSESASIVIQSYLEQLDIAELPAFRVKTDTLQKHAQRMRLSDNSRINCQMLRYTYIKLMSATTSAEDIARSLGQKRLR